LPFFGVLVAGAPAKLIFLILAALMAYCTWAVYRMKPAGWWVALITYAFFMVSAMITFARINLMDLYRQMGFPEQQIAQMQQISFLNGHKMAGYMFVFAVPFFGFIVYLKKYFRPQQDVSE
jgi:hypothetical protein